MFALLQVLLPLQIFQFVIHLWAQCEWNIHEDLQEGLTTWNLEIPFCLRFSKSELAVSYGLDETSPTMIRTSCG